MNTDDKHHGITEMMGFLVVAREEGARLGSLVGFHVDLEKRSLDGISIRAGALAKPAYIPMSEVVQLGQDIVFVKSKASKKEMSDDLPRRLKSLQGCEVTSLDGKHLGALVDVDVSAFGWKIKALYLTGDRYLPVSPDEITVGEDAILVPASYLSRIEDASEPGFLARMGGKEAIQDLSSAISRALKRVTERHEKAEEEKKEEAKKD